MSGSEADDTRLAVTHGTDASLHVALRGRWTLEDRLPSVGSNAP